MKEITVSEFKKLQDEKTDYQLIDVREDHELEICEMGGDHIPMGESTLYSPVKPPQQSRSFSVTVQEGSLPAKISSWKKLTNSESVR